MKIPNRFKWMIAIFVVSLQLSVLFTNCSVSKFSSAYNVSKVTADGTYIDQGDEDNSGENPDLPTEPEVTSTDDIVPTTVTAVGGKVTVYQDLKFSFAAAAGATGTYTSTALPAWIKFDSTTGTLVGIPTKMSDKFSFSVSNGSKSFGPFSIDVIGNPLKEYQWSLNNTGQNSFALKTGKAGEDIHMTHAVASGLTGEGVTIAISDRGVNLTHENLAPNVLPNVSRNYQNNYASTGSWIGDPTPDQSEPNNAHGTAVASLAAARGWTNVGIRGVAPKAKFAGFLYIQAQDQLNADGYGITALNDQFAGNFDIFNYSWNAAQCVYDDGYPSSYFEKLKYGVTSQRNGLGSIYVKSAGNHYFVNIQKCDSSQDSSYVLGNVNFSDANTTPYTILTAAVNADGYSTSYSSVGSAIWISSPGGEFGESESSDSTIAVQPALLSADLPGCDKGFKTLSDGKNLFDLGKLLNTSCNYTASMNGTSSAAPIVSGAVALLLQANPKLTWRDVKYILAKTADKINPGTNPIAHPFEEDLPGHNYDLGWITNAAGFNYQNYYGFGRLNVDKAVALAKNFASPLGTFKTTDWKHASSTLNLTVPDYSATGLTRSMVINDSLTLEAVQVKVSLNSCVSDVGLELTSPSGTKSVLVPINSGLIDAGIDNHTFLSNAFYGEKSTGSWSLKIIDGKSGCQSTFVSWKMNFFGY